MRRGLMRWDAEELPAAALQHRIARLRECMRREKLDAFLVYTNLVRPSAVCWLTGFTPYWSEGALMVLGDGAPVFVTALSKRVAEWIKSTNTVSEVTNAPRPGRLLGERLAADAAIRHVGVLELDALPAGLADDLAAAAPAVALVDASAAFADLRRRIDDAERKLLARADAMALDALNRVDASDVAEAGAGAIAGEVEQYARLAGAEEAYIAVAPDLDADRRLLRISRPTPLGNRFAVRASIAYKGAWVRRIRSFARDEAGAAAVGRAEVWLEETMRGLDGSKPLADRLAARVNALAGAQLRGWMAESCIGSYPLQAVAGSAGPDGRPPGDFLVLTVDLTIEGRPWIGAMPVVVAR
jgi:hypothetical protein